MRVVLTADGPLTSLIAYFNHLGGASPTTQYNAALAVGMLWDYYVATRPTQASEHVQFLTKFVRHLATGTIGPDGSDPLDLNWYPVSPSRAREIVRQVTAYSDYCALVAGTAQLNPLVPATFAQRMAQYRRAQHQSAASLLKHLFTPAAAMQRARMGRQVLVRGVPTKDKNAPPYFPFSHDTTLFQNGFRRGDQGPVWERYHVRDMLIALLQRFGGLRVSEPFHLYVQDVEPEILDPHDAEWGTTAGVRIFHPSAGTITYADKFTRKRMHSNRAEYLMSQWGRTPRDQMTWGGERAGWKDPLLDEGPDNAMTVYWYPRTMGPYFWRLYKMYLRHLRPAGLDHPYLFVNLDESQDGSFGAPYRIESYGEQLQKAVARIGLNYSKAAGTTSHGLRHAYAQSLRASGVSEKTIQIALHHKSPLSQHVYTRPGKQAAAHELERAHARAKEMDALARAVRQAVPGEIAEAEARLRAHAAASAPSGLRASLDQNFPQLLP
jgi:hypothetical protein